MQQKTKTNNFARTNSGVYENILIPEDDILTSIRKEEGVFIYNFLKDKDINMSLEVGFAYGCSTVYIMLAHEGEHYAIDPFQKSYLNLGLANVQRFNLEDRFTFINDYSHFALPYLLKEELKFDFAFIDGGHKFDEIFLDFYFIDLLLRNGGFVLFHDNWLRATQTVASWIRKNKLNHKELKTPIENLLMFQKMRDDDRNWDHFNEFYDFKSLMGGLFKSV